MLSYPAFVENNSLLNTPPTFAIYMMKLVTDWLLRDIGGLQKMHEINRRNKAQRAQNQRLPYAANSRRSFAASRR